VKRCTVDGVPTVPPQKWQAMTGAWIQAIYMAWHFVNAAA